MWIDSSEGRLAAFDASAFDALPVNGGGVAIHRDSGSVFALNESAYLTLDAAISGAAPGQALVHRYGITPEAAEQIAEQVALQLCAIDQFVTPEECFVEIDGIHQFEDTNGWIGRVQLTSEGIKFSVDLDRANKPAERIQSMMPRALALLGVDVLHGSAVRTEDSLHAFVGESGAGKTTFAIRSASLIGDLVAEDKVVLSPGDKVVNALVAGEQILRNRADELALACLRHGEGLLPSTFRESLLNGASLPVATVSELSIERRRRGGALEVAPLAHPGAVAMITPHLFGLPGSANLRYRVFTANRLSTRCRVGLLFVPDGLEELSAALAANPLPVKW